MILMPSNQKKRAAQPGNLNALKHGFYTRRVSRSDLTGLETTQFNGLQAKIDLLRLLTRRLIDQSADATNCSPPLPPIMIFFVSW
jgi:hypothetical protein